MQLQKQRIKAIQVLPDELQEVGLKKGEFSETLVTKMSTPVKRGVWKGALWGSCRHRRPNGRGH